MSHFSMFLTTKGTVKLDNRNMGHAQGIGIILFRFPNCSIIYTVGTVYYFPGHLPTPSHQAPSNFMLDLKSLHLNLFNIVTFLTLKAVLGDHPTRLKTILTIFKSIFSESILKDTGILLYQLSVRYQKQFLSAYS